MATVPEVQLMKPRSFSDGTDEYAGIREIRWQTNPLPTYGVRLEGQLRPTRHELVENDQPKVTGTAVFSGPAPDALLDTTIASGTFSSRDVTHASNASTVTFTNLTIKGSQGGVDNRTVSGFTYQFEATAVAVGAPA